jgi:SAM-dependent methyltransferase
MSFASENCDFRLASPKLHRRLAEHNRRWAELAGNCWCHLPDPGPGALYVEHDWRLQLNTYLPWSQFRQSLRGIGRCFLPGEDWLPFPLNVAQGPLQNLAPEETPDNLADFWELLPAGRWGQTTFSPDELLPLFCSLADPPRFGTDCQRYPRQRNIFLALLEQNPMDRPLSILDLGCGVGLGTYELASVTALVTGRDPRVVGLTREPLEVWMAMHRTLPHDSRRHFPDYPGTCKFQVGTASEFQLDAQFDYIFCNGLAGGRFLASQGDLRSFLYSCQRHLRPGGHVLLANHFHQGFQRACENLAQLASAAGWKISGDWQNLVLAHW